MRMKRNLRNPAVAAWWAVGGVLALGVAFMFIREIPAMRRELQILRM